MTGNGITVRQSQRVGPIERSLGEPVASGDTIPNSHRRERQVGVDAQFTS
jgi:hypothetical protein